MDDSINLDVHAISDLKTRGLPPTNDQPKYSYTSDDTGSYSKLLIDAYVHVCVLFTVMVITS